MGKKNRYTIQGDRKNEPGNADAAREKGVLCEKVALHQIDYSFYRRIAWGEVRDFLSHRVHPPEDRREKKDQHEQNFIYSGSHLIPRSSTNRSTSASMDTPNAREIRKTVSAQHFLK